MGQNWSIKYDGEMIPSSHFIPSFSWLRNSLPSRKEGVKYFPADISFPPFFWPQLSQKRRPEMFPGRHFAPPFLLTVEIWFLQKGGIEMPSGIISLPPIHGPKGAQSWTGKEASSHRLIFIGLPCSILLNRMHKRAQSRVSKETSC